MAYPNVQLRKLDPQLKKEPVSLANPAFMEAIDSAIASSGFVVLTVRFAGCGGARDYFIFHDVGLLETELRRFQPKTSIAVHTAGSFDFVGRASAAAEETAKELLAAVLEKNANDNIDLIRTDGEQGLLTDDTYEWVESQSELEDWFRKHGGEEIAIGRLEFWHENSDAIFTAYVPDDDGKVRPGAY